MHSMYGEVSPDGIDHYPTVLDKMAAEHLVAPSLTSQELSRIVCRTLVMVADDDEVSLEHAIDMYRALPAGELAVVPGHLTDCLSKNLIFAISSSLNFSLETQEKLSHRYAESSDVIIVAGWLRVNPDELNDYLNSCTTSIAAHHSSSTTTKPDRRSSTYA